MVYDSVVVVDFDLIVYSMGIDIASSSPSHREPQSQLIIDAEPILPMELLFDFDIAFLESGDPHVDSEVFVITEITFEDSGGEGVKTGPIFGANRGRRLVEDVVIDNRGFNGSRLGCFLHRFLDTIINCIKWICG